MLEVKFRNFIPKRLYPNDAILVTTHYIRKKFKEMKKIIKIILIIIIGIVILLVAGQFFANQNFFHDIMDNAGQDPNRFDHEIESQYARGNNPMGVRTFTVNVPQSYNDNSDKKYPVLFHVIDDSEALEITNKIVTELSTSDEIAPMVIVSLHSTGWNPGRDTHSAVEDKNYQGPTRFLNHIEKEVIPFLRANYRVSEERISTGWSRFGLFPDYALILKPQLFQGYIKSSVAGHGSVPEVLYGRLGDLLKQRPELAARYYFTVGSEENQRHEAFHIQKEIMQVSAPTGLIWKASILDNADHGATFERGLKEGLKFYFANTQKYQ